MPQPDKARRGRVQFTAPMADIKVSMSGAPEDKGAWRMRGHASVFNELSHDLGGFRVKIGSDFFTKVLAGNPDVHLNREHDMRLLLARTRAGSLTLTPDDYGLDTQARFVKTPLADETAILMNEGVLDQMSFACDIADSVWSEDEDGNITWTLLECEALYDVTICAQGAFPQTNSRLAVSLKDADTKLAFAREAGYIVTVPTVELGESAVTADGQGGSDITQPDAAEGASSVTELSRGGRDLAALKEWAEGRFAQVTSD